MKIDIKVLEKISLEPGDVLVIKTRKPLDSDVFESLSEMFRVNFPYNTFISAGHDDKFEVIRQELLK